MAHVTKTKGFSGKGGGSGYVGHTTKQVHGGAGNNIQMSRLNEGGQMKWKGSDGSSPTSGARNGATSNISESTTSVARSIRGEPRRFRPEIRMSWE